MSRSVPSSIAGIVLAGGQGRRMGGADKALIDLCGQPLVAHVIARLGCARAISANGDPARLARFGLPVLPDEVPGFAGPLAGVLAGLDWAAAQGCSAIITAAADTPFFPATLAAVLSQADPRALVVLAAGSSDDGGPARVQPTFARWSTTLVPRLRADLTAGMRRVEDAARTYGAITVKVPGARAFFNINDAQDLGRARSWMAFDTGTSLNG